jgi:hypothetical protein
MNEKQIKRKLEDRGLRVVDVAKAMHEAFPITLGSSETMLRELIAGRRWFPVYVDWLKANYDIVVDKPSWMKPVRERMRQAA